MFTNSLSYVLGSPQSQMQRSYSWRSQVGEVGIEAFTALLVPPSLIPGLIKALEIQLEKYETKFGKIARQEE